MVSSTMAGAWELAATQWNLVNGGTNISIDYVGYDYADLILRSTTDANLTLGCILTPSADHYTNYNPDECEAANNDVPLAMQRDLAHEIGHFLGLQHGDSPLMAGCAGDQTCAQCIRDIRPAPSDLDANFVVTCNAQTTEIIPGESYTDEIEEPIYGEDGVQTYDCYNTYAVTQTYECYAGGCHLSSQTYTYVSGYCFPIYP